MKASPKASLRMAGRLFPLLALLALLAALPADDVWAADDPASPKTAAPAGADAGLVTGDLGQGRYSSMHMTLQKTFIKINVATIDVRFDRQAQARFAALAREQPYSDAIASRLAEVAMGAERAVVEMRFMRDVPLKRWMGVVSDNLEQAREAGLITKEVEQQVNRGLPDWFSALRDRGYEKGDRLVYTIGADSLRTMVAAKDGPVFLDRVDRGASARRVVLVSYFAPKSEFREPLLRSLLDPTR
jgi:hypothetical protein